MKVGLSWYESESFINNALKETITFIFTIFVKVIITFNVTVTIKNHHENESRV